LYSSCYTTWRGERGGASASPFLLTVDITPISENYLDEGLAHLTCLKEIMKIMKKLALLRLFCCIIICLSSCGITMAQSKKATVTADDDQSIQSLLKEVRLMRMALERATKANLDSNRAQLSAERLRIQQEHVDRLARQRDAARNDLIEIRVQQKQLVDRIKELEDIIKDGIDPEQSKQAEIELKQIKPAIDALAAKEKLRSAQESESTSQLETEERELGDMKKQLDKLMQKLESSNATETPEATGKRP
jgi:hypothetical protein